MKLIVGYDRDLTACYFRSSLRELIRPGENPLTTISPRQVDYFAERLAETSVFSSVDTRGNPWVQRDEARELAKLVVKKASRTQLQRCEDVANVLLILEGVVGRVGATKAGNNESMELLRRRIQVAEVLYRKAARGVFHTATEIGVLNEMSRHVFDWVRYLSYLPGREFMDSSTPTDVGQKFLLS